MMCDCKSFSLRRHRRDHLCGFTLLEVIVAMAVVAMIAAALFASLTVAFRARQSAERGLAHIRQARVTMDLLGKDLQGALPPTGILAGAFIAQPDATGQEMDSLEFFSVAPPGPAIEGAGDVQRVLLSVMTPEELAEPITEPDTLDAREQGPSLKPLTDINSPQYLLVRSVTRRLLAPVTPQPSRQVIARHVRAFVVRFYDGTQWLDTWDSTTLDNTLPLAVEITLTIDTPTGNGATAAQDKPYTLVRIYPLACANEAGLIQELSLLEGSHLP